MKFVAIIVLGALSSFSATLNLFGLEIEVFPSRRPYSQIVHNAIGLSPETYLAYGYSFVGETDVIRFGGGGRVPFFALKPTVNIVITNGGYGVIDSHFDPISGGSDFIHADYLVGAFTELALDGWLFGLDLFHSSSHLGDDYIRIEEPLIEAVGIEAIKFYATRIANHGCYYDIGYEGKFGSRPDRLIFYRHSVLLGAGISLAEFGFLLRLAGEIEVISLHQLPNIGIRLSYPLNDDSSCGDKRLRLAHEVFISWYHGYSKQGYFYNGKEHLILAGFAFRI